MQAFQKLALFFCEVPLLFITAEAAHEPFPLLYVSHSRSSGVAFVAASTARACPTNGESAHRDRAGQEIPVTIPVGPSANIDRSIVVRFNPLVPCAPKLVLDVFLGYDVVRCALLFWREANHRSHGK